MADIHFISDPGVMQIISTILDIVGPNYSVPFDSSAQPGDGSKRNTDDLLQYQLPAGASLQGYSDPAQSQSIGNAINSMLVVLAPFLSAYQLLLPIIGVIKGIIEVICSLLNPWAVVSAIIKLFAKYIPAFVSLFPPLAGVVLVLSTIKAILAIVFYILTTIVPWIQLIISNIQTLSDAFNEKNRQKLDAGRKKLLSLIMSLLNQLGVLNIIKPIIEIIFIILNLLMGFPCADDESTCCDNNVCPPVLKDPPKGQALLIPSFYGETEPGFAWNIITINGNSRLQEIKPFMQSLKAQLDPQLDEPIDESISAGQTGDSAHFRVKLTSRRGGSRTITSPIVKIKNNTIVAVDLSLFTMVGVINYEVVPNWEILIGRNIVGLGCHPDVDKTKKLVMGRFKALPRPVVETHPESASIKNDYYNAAGDVAKQINNIKKSVGRAVFYPSLVSEADTDNFSDIFNDIKNVIGLIDTTNPKDPPYDVEIAEIEGIRDYLVQSLIDYSTGLKTKMQAILNRASDGLGSIFEVDKHLVAVGKNNYANIYITPKDISGSLLLKNLPDGVDIKVEINTNFGTIKDQISDKSTGIVSAKLYSNAPGEATLTAKVNTEYIVEEVNFERITKTQKVKFVSEAILPTRRFVSKKYNSKTTINTSINNEKEPGGN